MAPKKGVNLEDKRDRMLAVIQQSNTCWLLKDLEKIGPKHGVISQSVKDVIQMLVDDDLVTQDKCGQSNWFWSFPSESGHKLKKKRATLEPELARLKKRRAELETQQEVEKAARPESEDMTANLAKVAELELKQRALKKELEEHSSSNPELFEKLQGDITRLHEGVNRWTDNIFMLQKWCDAKFGGEPGRVKESFKQMGTDLDKLDYLE